MRRHRATLRVLEHFLRLNGTPAHGLAVMRATGLKSGSAYPILARLSAAGYLYEERERADPRTMGRPCRVYYTITLAGREWYTGTN